MQLRHGLITRPVAFKSWISDTNPCSLQLHILPDYAFMFHAPSA